jgi:uncharacterized protein (DUF4213/DUF364 family)
VSSTVLDRVAAALEEAAATARNPRVTVGDGVVLVELDHPDHGRLAGLAHRPDGDPAAVGLDVDAASVPALADLATGGGTHLGRAIGVATLNALSAPAVDWQAGDPMEDLPADVVTIGTVVLFGPALRKFDAVEVRVVERDPPDTVPAPEGVTVRLFEPADCEAAFDGVDRCFVTGSVLVYGGLDRYLSVLSAAGVAPVVLVGATASHLPGPAFAAGADIVAGASVTDPDRVRSRVAAGDCATDLHGAGVEKVYVADSDHLAGSERDGTA